MPRAIHPPPPPPPSLRRHLLCFPRGNGRSDVLSLYLAVPDAEDQPLGWERSAAFKLSLLSSLSAGGAAVGGAGGVPAAAPAGLDFVKDTQHTFSSRETDWGECDGGRRGSEGGAVRGARVCG